MAVTVVTFANLGRKHNLKTPDILPAILTFEEHGELKQVICQINAEFPFEETVQAVPSLIRRLLLLIERITRVSLPRRISEGLFDYFAEWKLAAADAYLFHGGYFLPKTFRKAKKMGGVLIDLAVVAHLENNAALEKTELERLGFAGFKGTYEVLAETVAHDNNFDHVVALSEFVKESYIAAGYPAAQIYLAHPDVDTARFVPTKEPISGFRVVYAAYTTPLKGLEYLLGAWERLELPDAELVLVGGYGYMPGPLKQKYDDIIARNPSITWVESTTTPETFYQSASVLVFPSLTEGFGRVTLEAMACGIPVITTENARGIVEDGKTGFVVPIRDANAIREKLEYLYHNQEATKEMGREARRAVEQKKPFGEAVYEIYQDILKREENLNRGMLGHSV